jgi:hypothetical protein
MVNDVWVNGQCQDVWCRSNKIITDPSFYNAAQVYDDVTKASCFILDMLTRKYFETEPIIANCNPAVTLIQYVCMCSDY